ncbi:MAG: hypothetical protein QOE80_3966 [Actinomycetota bacterium]|jgi:uncharacterized RDD family membrane protein YckC|nr:hypothetical protein [Actinomycetota bacterium]
MVRRFAPWLPVFLLALLVVFTPWLILGVLVLPARPGRPDLPMLVGGCLLSIPWVAVAVLARRTIKARRESRAR